METSSVVECQECVLQLQREDTDRDLLLGRFYVSMGTVDEQVILKCSGFVLVADYKLMLSCKSLL